MLIDPRKVWAKKAYLEYYNIHGSSGFLRDLQMLKNREWEKQFHEISPLSELIFFLDVALQEIALNPYFYGWKSTSPMIGRGSSTLMLRKRSTSISIDWQEIGFGNLRCSTKVCPKQTTQIWNGGNYFYSSWVFEEKDDGKKDVGELDMFLSSNYGLHTLGYLLSVRYSGGDGDFEPIISTGIAKGAPWIGQFQQNISDSYSYEKAIEQAFSFLEAALYIGQNPDNPEYTRSW